MGNLNGNKPPFVGSSCRTEQWGYRFYLGRNSTFLRMFLLILERLLILLWHETQGCLCRSGTVFLVIFHLAKPHYHYFEWSILSCDLITSLVEEDSFQWRIKRGWGSSCSLYKGHSLCEKLLVLWISDD